ncbi:MAG: winged helix-turn-helix transcriptional regulator, partial [Thermodesulfobacteriota bacterium]
MYESKKITEIYAVYNVDAVNTLSMICGKWKLNILYSLRGGAKRFNALQRELMVSPRTLSIQLKKLEQSQIVVRKVYMQMPLKVEYSLSDIGETLIPILGLLEKWSTQY